MRITLTRFASLEDASIGALYIDGRFTCFTLEDEYREAKVPGETRIPVGLYQIEAKDRGRAAR